MTHVMNAFTPGEPLDNVCVLHHHGQAHRAAPRSGDLGWSIYYSPKEFVSYTDEDTGRTVWVDDAAVTALEYASPAECAANAEAYVRRRLELVPDSALITTMDWFARTADTEIGHQSLQRHADAGDDPTTVYVNVHRMDELMEHNQGVLNRTLGRELSTEEVRGVIRVLAVDLKVFDWLINDHDFVALLASEFARRVTPPADRVPFTAEG